MDSQHALTVWIPIQLFSFVILEEILDFVVTQHQQVQIAKPTQMLINIAVKELPQLK